MNSLILFGGILIVVGLALIILGRLGLPLLPGDILIKRDGFIFYFPIATSILISVILTIIFLFLRK